MVSNSLKITQEEVVTILKRLHAEHEQDAEYRQLRQDLPKEWPI